MSVCDEGRGMATFRDFAAQNSDGWSFIAIQSPIDRVAERIRDLDSVTGYAENVTVCLMANSMDEEGNSISLTPSPNARTCFVVAMEKGRWCIVFRTLYWCEVTDHDWVRETARSLSESLHGEAIVSCGGGHGFSTCVYNGGTLESELPAYDRAVVAKLFTSRKIRLPLCFIGGTPTTLYAERESANEMLRVDQFECRITNP